MLLGSCTSIGGAAPKPPVPLQRRITGFDPPSNDPAATRSFSYLKELAVLFVSQHGDQVSCRVGRLRIKPEAGLLNGPLNRGVALDERTFEALRRVEYLRRLDGAAPFYIERNLRVRRRHARNLRVRKTQAAGKSEALG